jgi:hypothetical protein
MSLSAFLPVLGPLVDKLLALIPDPDARARAEAEYQSTLLAAVITEKADNREINKAEARHQSLFVAGWRPAIGWVCAFAVAYQYLIRPGWVWIAGVWFPGTAVPPGLDDMLWELMFGMLGIGGLRTMEKLKGKAG